MKCFDPTDTNPGSVTIIQLILIPSADDNRCEKESGIKYRVRLHTVGTVVRLYHLDGDQWYQVSVSVSVPIAWIGLCGLRLRTSFRPIHFLVWDQVPDPSVRD